MECIYMYSLKLNWNTGENEGVTLPFIHNFYFGKKSAIVISVHFKLYENGTGNRSLVYSRLLVFDS